MKKNVFNVGIMFDVLIIVLCLKLFWYNECNFSGDEIIYVWKDLIVCVSDSCIYIVSFWIDFYWILGELVFEKIFGCSFKELIRMKCLYFLLYVLVKILYVYNKILFLRLV